MRQSPAIFLDSSASSMMTLINLIIQSVVIHPDLEESHIHNILEMLFQKIENNYMNIALTQY